MTTNEINNESLDNSLKIMINHADCETREVLEKILSYKDKELDDDTMNQLIHLEYLNVKKCQM